MSVQALVGHATVRGGGLNGGGWRSLFAVEHSNVRPIIWVKGEHFNLTRPDSFSSLSYSSVVPSCDHLIRRSVEYCWRTSFSGRMWRCGPHRLGFTRSIGARFRRTSILSCALSDHFYHGLVEVSSFSKFCCLCFLNYAHRVSVSLQCLHCLGCLNRARTARSLNSQTSSPFKNSRSSQTRALSSFPRTRLPSTQYPSTSTSRPLLFPSSSLSHLLN